MKYNKKKSPRDSVPDTGLLPSRASNSRIHKTTSATSPSFKKTTTKKTSSALSSSLSSSSSSRSERVERSDIETLNVRLPLEVLNMLDALVEKKLFSSRSEAIREFCRDYVRENRNTSSSNPKTTKATNAQTQVLE